MWADIIFDVYQFKLHFLCGLKLKWLKETKNAQACWVLPKRFTPGVGKNHPKTLEYIECYELILTVQLLEKTVWSSRLSAVIQKNRLDALLFSSAAVVPGQAQMLLCCCSSVQGFTVSRKVFSVDAVRRLKNWRMNECVANEWKLIACNSAPKQSHKQLLCLTFITRFFM